MIILNAITIGLIVYFLKYTTWPGQIWERPYKWLESRIDEYWFKPLLGCPVCMTPWWGSILYVMFHFLGIPGFQDVRIQMIILTVFVAAGFNTIILMFNKEYDV